MGCSASKPTTFLHSKNNYPQQISSSSSSSPSLESSNFSSSPLPIHRALSLQTPLVHHPPSKKGDSHHLVSLTSTTYGSLLLVEPRNSKLNNENQPQSPPNSSQKPTQVSDEPGESLSPDSVINTWELMDGLDDDDDYLDFQMGNSLNPKPSFSDHAIHLPSKSISFKHLGFDGSVRKLNDPFDTSKYEEETAIQNPCSLSKPLWKHLSEESFLSDMDPSVVSSYRRALSSRQLDYTTKDSKTAASVGSSPMNYSSTNKNCLFLHNPDEKVVIYFTSLRGIRKTYEDCCAVRMIFRGFEVPVDERDISMDSSYRKELESKVKGKAMSLPQVFMRGKHVGGVEEIRQLNEAGELANLLDGFPVKDPKTVCENCGEARFLPCPNCNGSRKVFDMELEQLRRCPHCNENGLIRCPGCCS